MAAAADFRDGEAAGFEIFYGVRAQVEPGEVEARETLGELGHGGVEFHGDKVMAMEAASAMAVATGEIECHLLAGGDDAVEVARMAAQKEVGTGDCDLVEPDEFFERLLAIVSLFDFAVL